jgi:hypothetical protein
MSVAPDNTFSMPLIFRVRIPSSSALGSNCARPMFLQQAFDLVSDYHQFMQADPAFVNLGALIATSRTVEREAELIAVVLRVGWQVRIPQQK